MLRVGLTGGIGSGKSSVAGLLRGHGAHVIDADAISRATTAPGGSAMAAIAESFGPDYLAADGSLNRERMRQASFSDPAIRARLEAIVHPLVGAESARQEQAAMTAGATVLVYDIPLLVESGRWRARVDAVVVVDCPAELQIARVIARSGLARDAVERIIGSQASRPQRLRAADAVVFNGSSSLDMLAADVERLAAGFGL